MLQSLGSIISFISIKLTIKTTFICTVLVLIEFWFTAGVCRRYCQADNERANDTASFLKIHWAC